MTAASAPRSPYGRAALRYYERALALRPGDLVLGCNAATSTYFLGDAGPLRALDSLPQAHVALADDYAGHGKGAVSLPMVAAYYRLALGEYERAIDLEPANVGALNGYGYAFWQWLLRGGHEFGPDSQMANRAVTYLRRGVVLSTAQHSEMELYARSTLGEVLLGSAHPREAEEELGYLFDHKLVPDHPLFDELRWDLAEAHLCAAAAHARAGLRSSKRAQATALFGTIRHNEANREFRPFTDRPDWLDPDRPLPLCTYHRARFP